jgi:hypothetical protein
MTMHGRSDASAPTSPAGRIVSRGDGLPERLSFTRAGTPAHPTSQKSGRHVEAPAPVKDPEAGAVSAIADHSSSVEADAAAR